MANAEPTRDAEVMDFHVEDASPVKNQTSSFITPILAVDIKVESSVSTEDGISDAEKYKQTLHCNEQGSEMRVSDTESIINEVKVEKNPSSVENETSLLNPLDFLALGEEQNEVSSDNEVYETGDFSDLFPEQDQTLRTVNLNQRNVSSPADCSSSYMRRDPCTETHLIVKEEEEWSSKEVKILHESNSQPLPKNGQLFKGDESNQSAASYGKVSVRPVWELCEEGFYKSPSTAVDEPSNESQKLLGEPQKSRAYYYSHGYKLAHVSVVLEDLKSHPTSCTTEKHLPGTSFSPNFNDASESNYLKTEDKPCMITHAGEEPSSSAYCQPNFNLMSELNCDSQAENEFHRTTHTTEEAFSRSYLPEFVHTNGSNASRFEDKSYPVTQTVEEPFSQAYFPPNFSHTSGSDGYSSMSRPSSHPFEEPFSQAYCPPNFSHTNGSSHSRMQDGSHPSTHPFEEPYSRTHCSPEFHHGSNGYWLPDNVTVESSDGIPHPYEEPQTYHTPEFSLRDSLNVNFKRLLKKQPEETSENVNCQRLIEKPPEERNKNVNCKRSIEKQPEERNKIVNCKRSTKKPRLEMIKNANFKCLITNQPEEINKNVNFKHFIIKQLEGTEDLPYSCAYCSAKFSQNGTLISHLKIHTSAEPFSCLYCHVRFDDNSALKSHLRVHT